VIRLIRLIGASLGALIGLAFVLADAGPFERTGSAALIIPVWVIAWISVGFLLLPYLTVVPAARLVHEVQRMSTAEFVASVAGLLIGLLMGLLLGLPLSALPEPYGRYLPLGVSICMGLGMVGLTVAKREDLVAAAQAAGLVRPPDAEQPRDGHALVVVDTSAIIDGRIADISEAGFIPGTLVLPRFVLDELRHIADSADALRRNRGRRGLDILNRLQKESPVPIEITDNDFEDLQEVDSKLVRMASIYGCPIVTNDFNLNRVAELEGVRVLNINQLANAVKSVVLPGEEMAIRVIQEGKETGQGVGFLEDGTMVVVEGGRRHLNDEIEITVTRVLQTVAGRMIFAQPKGNGKN
jgi:uncharacterized protein YacL